MIHNACKVCSKSKPCLCDLENYKWDTTKFKVLPPNAGFYEVIRILKGESK